MLKASARLVLFLSLAAAPLLSDVVELKTGERLEGTFKQATSAGVVIEVGGQSITMPLEKVRAIYLGSAPAPAGQVPKISAALDALQSLKALQSATEVGVSYRDYATRVLDAKVKVDQFVQSSQEKDTPGRDVMRVAMRYYELASQAWNGHITNSFPREVGRVLEDDQEINGCSAVKALIVQKNDFFATYRAPVLKGRNGQPIPDPDPQHFGFLANQAGQRPATLWSCASDKITEAERLIK